MNNRAWVALFLLIITVSALVWQAYHPWWRPHLQTDAVAYQIQALHFRQTGSWAGLQQWYQPAALWFFVLISYLAWPPTHFDHFLAAVIGLNVVLIAAHFYFFARHGHRYSTLFFALILLAFGPIVLYRFELLATLLVIWSWHFWQRRQVPLAGFLLGLAVAVKVYPIVLLPLFLAESIRTKDWRHGLSLLIWVVEGIALPTAALFLFGSSLADILAGVLFHDFKPVGLEGAWGSFITLVQMALDIPIRMTPGFGVHGLTSDLPLLTNDFLNQVWLIPYSLVFAVVLWLFRRRGYTDPLLALLLLFVFVLFAKVLNFHYILWYLVFLPVVPLFWYRRWEWTLILVLVSLSLVLSQIVYPLYFTEFLEWYYGHTEYSIFFTIAVVRNLLLVALLGILLRGLWRSVNQIPATSFFLQDKKEVSSKMTGF